MGRDNASFNRKTRERASAGGHLVNASLPILSNNSRICMQIRRAGRKRKEEAAQRGSHLILLGDTELLLRRHNCWNMKNCFSIQPTRLEAASYAARRRHFIFTNQNRRRARAKVWRFELSIAGEHFRLAFGRCCPPFIVSYLISEMK